MFAVRRYLVNATNPSARGLATLSVESFGVPSKVVRYDAKPAAAKTPGADEVSVKVAFAPVLLEDVRKIRGISLNSTQAGVAGSTAVGKVGGDLVFVSDVASWADTITVSRNKVHKLADISAEDAASIPAFVPAWAILKDIHAVAGDNIVQSDADSAVGQALTQLAKANNINVINITAAELSDPKAAEILKSKGTIKGAVSGSSGKHIHTLTKVVAAQGKIVLHNAVYQSLDNVTGVDLPIGRTIFQGVKIHGFDYLGWSKHHPDQLNKGLQSILQLAQAKKITLKPTVYEAADYLKAINEVEKTGKLSALKF